MADIPQLSMSIDPRGELLEAARACETEVFLQAFGNTTEQWETEYGPYESSAVFVALTEPGGDVVAAMRMLLPTDIGLKTLDDTLRAPWFVDGYRSARAAGVDVNATIDVATLAVRPHMRGGAAMAASAMYYAIFRIALMSALPNLVMIMDGHARGRLTAAGCLTHMLPGTRPGSYLGSERSAPVWMHVPTMFDNQRRLNPDAFRLLSQGVGLDVVLPPASAFDLQSRLMDTMTVHKALAS